MVTGESPLKKRRTSKTTTSFTSSPATTRRKSSTSTPGTRRGRWSTLSTSGSGSTLNRPSQAWHTSSRSSRGEQKAPGMTVPGSSPTRDPLLPHPFFSTTKHLHGQAQGERRRDHHQSNLPPEGTLQNKLFGKDDEMLAVSSSSSSSATRSSATSHDFPSSSSSGTKK